MLEALAVLSGIMKAAGTLSAIADGKTNGLHGLTQLTSGVGSVLGSFVGGK